MEKQAKHITKFKRDSDVVESEYLENKNEGGDVEAKNSTL